MARPAAWGVLQQYITSGLGILVLLTGRGLVLYAVTLSCCGIVSLVPNLRYLWPELRDHLRIDPAVWRTVFLGGLPFASWAAISLFYGYVDILMLQAMTDDATVGWYGVAWAWVGFPAFFSALVVAVFLPSLSAEGAAESANFSVLANKALRLVMFVGAPVAAGIALVAQPTLALLYPPDFQNAVPLLRILALHIPFVAMDMILGIALIARDRQKQWLIVGCLAAVFNPVVNLGLIPFTTRVFDNGAIGAAIATVATEGLMMAGAIYLRPEGRARPVDGRLPRPLPPRRSLHPARRCALPGRTARAPGRDRRGDLRSRIAGVAHDVSGSGARRDPASARDGRHPLAEARSASDGDVATDQVTVG